eukprot:TRINITY_DN7910_c0_g1_i1.p1 TRINITY_DN7910_c0_g1~~TRINITY_DN7910_c0_g1_i1.p1  ORF type:complete len:218 (-),score=30.65 TRINITY_DN7910_c0_g1_i1:45-698(-)
MKRKTITLSEVTEKLQREVKRLKVEKDQEKYEQQSNYQINEIKVDLDQKSSRTPKVFLIERFMKMCHRHKELLIKSCIIDQFILSTVLLYFQRAELKLVEWQDERNFFYALTLALETEEDVVDSIVEVVEYVVGRAPKSDGTSDERYKASWTSKFKRYNQGKDVLWKRMDYRTVVSYQECLVELSYFPTEPDFNGKLLRSRTDKDLELIYQTLANTE